MSRVVNGNSNHAPDVQAFIDLLNSDLSGELFDTNSDLIVTRAPGRLDLMGGIADYSGSHVLEFPIAEATFAAVQLSTSRRLNLVTWLDGKQEVVSIPTDRLEGLEYRAAREVFQKGWAAYVAGVFLVLMRERGLDFTSGANVLISSHVPAGKGVSSSAALEVAVLEAVAAAFDISIDPHDKALLCQKVENLVVGAPCGVMDQMTAVFGKGDRLLFLLCQPAELKRMIALPRRLLLWGIDSGIRHSVSGADYASVRAGAFMGARIIAELKPDLEYLANISPAEFEREYRDQLPEHMSGQTFLTRYQETSDPVTSIERDEDYAVRMPTAHPIYENARVQRFVELLDQREDFNDLKLLELGELMYESHDSYTALGLNSDGTDLLVELVRKEGPRAGLFGAKITGGGSGGTVAVLGDQTSRAAIDRVVKRYAEETGHEPYMFTGSSSGSLTFGHLRLPASRTN
jgi:galactokinase